MDSLGLYFAEEDKQVTHPAFGRIRNDILWYAVVVRNDIESKWLPDWISQSAYLQNFCNAANLAMCDLNVEGLRSH